MLRSNMKSKKKSSTFLKRYIQELKNEDVSVKSLRVFDFDDTLVFTDATVKIVNADGTVQNLLSGQFAEYQKQTGDVFDYSGFTQLINPRIVAWTEKIFKQVYEIHGPKGLIVLSLRPAVEPINEMLSTMGINDIEVVALSNADNFTKANWISDRIKRDNLELVEFFDDSYANVAAVKELKKLHVGSTKIIVRHVIHTHIPTHGYARHYGTSPDRRGRRGRRVLKDRC